MFVQMCEVYALATGVGLVRPEVQGADFRAGDRAAAMPDGFRWFGGKTLDTFGCPLFLSEGMAR